MNICQGCGEKTDKEFCSDTCREVIEEAEARAEENFYEIELSNARTYYQMKARNLI